MANKTSRLQQWIESIWYDEAKANSVGRYCLMPLSYVYSAINTYLRKSQTKHRVTIDCPIIVVGNITVGGTGKTPLSIYIVKRLQKAGYKPAIITRGYGGTASTWPQKVTAGSDANLVGDEAVLMATRTGVPVYAGANRLDSIKQLLNDTDCDVVVSDDGMQHYKLPRDIQIAVIDGQRQLGNGFCLPAGPLREHKARLNECDLIVVNGKNSHKSRKSSHEFADTAFEMSLTGTSLINLSTHEEKPMSDFADKQVQAITGIGNPQRFYSTLRSQGLKVLENSFPDHYAFDKNDLLFTDEVIVVMTEKDAVKCKALINDAKHYWVLPVTAQLSDDFDNKLLTQLENLPSKAL